MIRNENPIGNDVFVLSKSAHGIMEPIANFKLRTACFEDFFKMLNVEKIRILDLTSPDEDTYMMYVDADKKPPYALVMLVKFVKDGKDRIVIDMAEADLKAVTYVKEHFMLKEKESPLYINSRPDGNLVYYASAYADGSLKPVMCLRLNAADEKLICDLLHANGINATRFTYAFAKTEYIALTDEKKQAPYPAVIVMRITAKDACEDTVIDVEETDLEVVHNYVERKYMTNASKRPAPDCPKDDEAGPKISFREKENAYETTSDEDAIRKTDNEQLFDNLNKALKLLGTGFIWPLALRLWKTSMTTSAKRYCQKQRKTRY